MLVLDIPVDQGCYIGPDIEVRLLKVRRYGARLGIMAPRSLPVHREKFGRPASESLPVTTDVHEQLRRSEARCAELELELSGYRAIEAAAQLTVRKAGAELVGDTR